MKATKTTKRKSRRAAGLSAHPRFDDAQVIERPDGWYWRSIDGRREQGPFRTSVEAEEGLEIWDEETLEVGETLEEAEGEIGIADWIDPETGDPAEEEPARLEEH